ncbi:MAG: hypothetical protein IKZ08_02045 [Bacteroidales bacterium]|nr:hypothetical protein [Bacteroidales bacterium]
MKNKSAAGIRARSKAVKEKDPRWEQFQELTSLPIQITWSDGSTSQSNLGQTFWSEESYQRYAGYKAEGKIFPVSVAAAIEADKEKPSKIFPEGTQADDQQILQKMCQDFTKALKQYLDLEEATTEIMKQAEEATAAMQADLPDLQGADL